MRLAVLLVVVPVAVGRAGGLLIGRGLVGRNTAALALVPVVASLGRALVLGRRLGSLRNTTVGSATLLATTREHEFTFATAGASTTLLSTAVLSSTGTRFDGSGGHGGQHSSSDDEGSADTSKDSHVKE